jgi:hypothetical protein
LLIVVIDLEGKIKPYDLEIAGDAAVFEEI